MMMAYFNSKNTHRSADFERELASGIWFPFKTSCILQTSSEKIINYYTKNN